MHLDRHYQAELSKASLALIELAFKEDIADGDITTCALGKIGDSLTTAEINLKQNYAVVSGMRVVNEIIKYFNNTYIVPAISTYKNQNLKKKVVKVVIVNNIADGTLVKQNEIALVLRGKVKHLLMIERVLLNFLQRLSGIATCTYDLVSVLDKSNIKLLDTRKTNPGYRWLEKYAVRCGGGVNHRMGLYDQYLIKDNHIDRAEGISNALAKITLHQSALWKQRKSNNKKNFPCIEIECRTLAEVKKVVEFNQAQLNYKNSNSKIKSGLVNIIMLDNFSLSDIKKALLFINETALVEVSGNMNLKKIKELIELNKESKIGIDFISSGMITHSAPSVDYSMTIN